MCLYWFDYVSVSFVLVSIFYMLFIFLYKSLIRICKAAFCYDLANWPSDIRQADTWRWSKQLLRTRCMQSNASIVAATARAVKRLEYPALLMPDLQKSLHFLMNLQHMWYHSCKNLHISFDRWTNFNIYDTIFAEIITFSWTFEQFSALLIPYLQECKND